MGYCSVEMFPAAYGDCFLIRCVEGSEITNILVDAGLATTYQAALKPRLQELSANGEAISLFVVTHIDADHIGGAISLLEENGNYRYSKTIKINEIWHNSYRHIQPQSSTPTRLTQQQQEIIREVEARGHSKVRQTAGPNVESAISAKQGSSLASLVLKGGYPWNTSFSSGPVVCESPTACFTRGSLSLTLLSPNGDKLNQLSHYWKRELARLGFTAALSGPFDDAFEFLAANERPVGVQKERKISATAKGVDDLLKSPFTEDTSVTNGSSIAFMLEFENRRLLFLGDAHPALIERQLLAIDQNAALRFDLVKVAHHGSRANTSASILTRIRSSRFLFSSNGERFGHPDVEATLRIASVSGHKELIFNYPTPTSRFMQNPDLIKKFDYSIQAADGHGIVRVVL